MQQPTVRTKLGLTSEREDSGEAVISMHSLILRLLTLMHHPTDDNPLMSVTREKRGPRSACMSSASLKLNTARLRPLCLKPAQTFYRRLASMLSEKRNTNYSVTLGWLRCQISFPLLRWAITCIRGARSNSRHASRSSNIELAVTKGRFLD